MYRTADYHVSLVSVRYYSNKSAETIIEELEDGKYIDFQSPPESVTITEKRVVRLSNRLPRQAKVA